jgi:hypothetical protein
VKVVKSHQQGLVWPVVLTGLSGVGQWTRVWCSTAFSGLWGCRLVPRLSSTPVSTWTWPIWVVSRRHVLKAVFVLLEPSSPSRRIFIGSHSLPLSGSPFRSFINAPQVVTVAVWGLLVTFTIKESLTANSTFTIMESLTAKRCARPAIHHVHPHRTTPLGMTRPRPRPQPWPGSARRASAHARVARLSPLFNFTRGVLKGYLISWMRDSSNTHWVFLSFP